MDPQGVWEPNFENRGFTWIATGDAAWEEDLQTRFRAETMFHTSDVCVCDSELGPPGWREPLDCVRASELCNQNSQCSSRYRIMRQCLSGGDKERSAMLASKECQGALEVLQDSPLYDCRCKRGMKKELQCLQNYWSIHMGLTEDSSLSKLSPCSEAGKPCNPCLDAAKACNLNETCKRLRSAYNSICSKATPPQLSLANQEPCSRKRCQKACAERRRRTIVPSCSHQERHKPTCLELRRTCRSDALCRTRRQQFPRSFILLPSDNDEAVGGVGGDSVSCRMHDGSDTNPASV
ncbi:GDNF family receptor alpha-2 [Collichthys lucidus]|uniref:GDNF family receptor alpha-2 n=1 Tax=Collichthys lucidus TaxID=240159 RepID=A0A4U5VB30_COLLU|nr:GDNF family receptor alpha-2 [Collichthys lucidus]